MLKIHLLEHMSNYEEEDEARPETGGTGSSSPSFSSDSSSATLSIASQQGWAAGFIFIFWHSELKRHLDTSDQN